MLKFGRFEEIQGDEEGVAIHVAPDLRGVPLASSETTITDWVAHRPHRDQLPLKPPLTPLGHSTQSSATIKCGYALKDLCTEERGRGMTRRSGGNGVNSARYFAREKIFKGPGVSRFCLCLSDTA